MAGKAVKQDWTLTLNVTTEAFEQLEEDDVRDIAESIDEKYGHNRLFVVQVDAVEGGQVI